MTNTLTSAPVAPLLDRLFAEADESWAALAAMPADERARLMQGRADYIAFYSQLRDQPLPVSRATGTLLYMLARHAGAHEIVEFGTSFGLSTLHLAAALRDNGGGRLITCEFEPSKVERARENLAAGELTDLVEIRVGDALQTLREGLPDAIDLVLLDGAKALYPQVLDLLEGPLRPGALVVADNADDSPEYLARVRSPASGWLSTPFSQDVELSMRLG